MRSFLLLILSLMTGCGASFEVKGCPGGWTEFTFKFPKQSGNKHIFSRDPKLKPIKITQKDKWETTGSISWYYDTKNKLVKMAIKHLKEEDFGDYRCQIDKTSGSSESSESKDEGRTSRQFRVVKRDYCRGPFLQTAYRTARTTITCDYPENKSKSGVKFICKVKRDSTCEEISSTESPPESNGTFSLTETNSSLSMSISNVSSEDAGVYWCGLKSNDGRNRTALGKIQLEVENITDLMRFPTVGQTFTYSCEYPNGAPINKFICKGEDPSMCERLVSTAQRGDTGKFSIRDKKFGNMTVTVRDVTTDDTGTYWCGANSKDAHTHSNPFFSRLTMTVVSSTKSGNESADSYGSWLTVIIAAVVCAALLVLVLILVLVYKRFDRPKTTNEEAQNKEDGTYEEISELPPKPQPGTAMKTIYTTAKLPIYPSPAPHHHSYVNFHNKSAVVGADTHPPVRDNNQQRPTNAAANQPPRFPAGPLYSTVNLPQQH